MSCRSGVAMRWNPEPGRRCSARSRRAWVMMLGLAVVVCVFVVGVASAWAAAPELPEALTPGPVFATVAHLRGVLDPKIPEGTASEVLLYEFVYRESTKRECRGAGEVKTTQGMSLGIGEQEVPQEVTGLKPSTEYAVCVVAHNSANPLEATTSPAVTLKTVKAAPPEAPEATELIERKATSATLAGVVNPNHEGEPGRYRLVLRGLGPGEEGCTGVGETQTQEEEAPGFSAQSVQMSYPLLQEDHRYSFCIKAINALGESTLSNSVTFKTAIEPQAPERVQLVEAKPNSLEVKGVLNPTEEAEAGTYEFLYKRSSSECEGESATTPAGSHGRVAEEATGEATDLLPHTSYTFCLRAHNGATPEPEPSTPSTPATFTTMVAAPTVEGSVADVAATSATLDADIDPQGAQTGYQFELATQGSSFSPVAEPAGSGSVPEGTEPVAVSAHVQHGLAANTAYQLRVVVSNSAGEVTSAPVSFTTQSEGEALGVGGLPDHRAWELVSPPDRRGAAVEPADGVFGPVQGAAGGGAIAYGTTGAIEGAPEGNRALEASTVISTHGPAGWSTQDIASENEAAGAKEDGYAAGFGDEYKLFSPNLSSALVWSLAATPLPPTAEQTPLYLRYADGSFEALVTAANVETGVDFGTVGTLNEPDTSPNFAHVVFSSKVPLTSNATGEGLYEWSAGHLQLVSVLPSGGEPAPESLLGNGKNQNMAGAIASDGNAFWKGGEHLYMFDAETGRSVQLDAVQPGPNDGSGTADAVYQDTAAEGTEAFFTDGEELTPGASEGSLYAYDAQTGKLSDLTAPVNAGESAGVQGLLPGVAEDGSYVYAVAGGVLTPSANAYGETATAGADNLYELHQQGESWQPTFIATLSVADAPDWGGGEARAVLLTSRVSPNGEWLAFMSQRSLTGYDSEDASSVQRSERLDEEVYLYDAQSGKLLCASCNPSGARPAGIDDVEVEEVPPLVVGENVWPSGTWLAASVPGWTPNETGVALYQSRYLDNSGRLFFDSADALVPQAVNHTEDVYEYEPPVGAGGGLDSSPEPPNDSCTTTSSTYSPAAQGCIALISSGTASQESEFLDASESGDDVFFYSAARLTPQASASGYSVYDAHVCGAGWACAAGQQPVGVTPCESASECRAPSAPPGTSAGSTSASVGFEGAGNLAPAPLAAVVKSPTRAQKLADALRACRKDKKRSRRNKCEMQARTKYGAAKAKQSTKGRK
jgi:hypothetical protein